MQLYYRLAVGGQARIAEQMQGLRPHLRQVQADQIGGVVVAAAVVVEGADKFFIEILRGLIAIQAPYE